MSGRKRQRNSTFDLEDEFDEKKEEADMSNQFP